MIKGEIMVMQLKTLKKQWPKGKVKKEFKNNNQRYPDALKKAVLEAIEGTTQAEVSKATGIKPGLISNWKNGRFKGVKKKKVQAKKKKTSKNKKVKAEKQTAEEETYWDKLENDKIELIRLKSDMQWVSERIDEVKLVEYLEQTAEKLIFDDQRDLGYAISVVGEMIRLLKIYLKSPSKSAYEKLMKKLI
tara:strand:- start:1900 stop:2469 length:570 start_codon:yes stop_codon:yes gene_type:complete